MNSRTLSAYRDDMLKARGNYIAAIHCRDSWRNSSNTQNLRRMFREFMAKSEYHYQCAMQRRDYRSSDKA